MAQYTKIYEEKGKVEIPILNTKFTLEGIRTKEDKELWKINIVDLKTQERREIPDTSTIILKLLSSLYLDHSIEFNKKTNENKNIQSKDN